MTTLKQSFTYYKAPFKRATKTTILLLALATALTLGFYFARDVTHDIIFRELRGWNAGMNLASILSGLASLFLHALFFSILYSMLSQPAFFLWTDGRVPAWRLGFHIFKKSARTFKMIFTLFRASFQIAIAPLVFIFLYHEYFAKNSTSLTSYLFIATALIVCVMIFWRNSPLFSSLFAVSALDILPIQALFQIPSYVQLYQNQLTIEMLVIAGISILLASGSSTILTSPFSWQLAALLAEIVILWIALTAITHTILYAMSLSHDTKQQSDPTTQLKEALLTFIKERQRKQQEATQVYEEEVVVESYTVTNVTVEDEE